MRPDRRFGVGTAWLAMMASASLAFGQGWVPEPVDPKGHAGDVVAVAVAGQTMATAGSDGVAKVWDLVDAGKLSARLAHRVDLIGHAGKVLAVAVSPDGKIVATGGADRTVRLWDSAKGTPLATLEGHSGPVEALAFAPDGKTVASGGLDTTIRLWDVAAKRFAKAIQGHEQGVRGLAFSPDGKLVASAGRDHSVRLWNVPEGTERATLGRHDAPAWCVAFAPDGETVASGGLDKTVRLWRVVGDPAAQPIQKLGAGDQGQAAEPAGQIIRLRKQSDTFQIDQVRAELPDVLLVQQQRQEPGGSLGDALRLAIQLQGQGQPQPNQVQSSSVGADAVAVAFTPDGHHVAAALSDLAASRTTPGSVAFFALPPRQPGQPVPVQAPRATIRGHLGPIFGLAFPRTGGWVATVGGDASVRVWGASAAEPMAASIGRSRPEAIEERVMTHLDPVEALAITPDGRRVATASASDGVSLWDVSTRTLIGRLHFPANPVRVEAGGEPFAPARALAISPDGKTLATGGDGKTVSLWELDTGRLIDTLKGHLGAITVLAFGADGKTLASGSKDASVTLWDVVRRAEIATLARHTSAVTTLAFSPDGSMLASAGLDYTVKLWELPSGRYLDTLDAHKDVVDALAFSLDGKGLASGDRTGTVRFWDVAGRSERTTLRAFTSPFRALAFAPDGKTLVGGGDDGSIRRWDLSDGKVVALRGGAHAGPILALAFGPGGKTLATGGADRELKLWDTDARLAPGPFADLEGKVRQIVVSRDGKTLATASADQFARIWDVATGRTRIAPIAIEGDEARIALSPDGKFLATLTIGGAIEAARVWDVATGEVKAEPTSKTNGGSAIAFTPDGKSWATAGGGTVELWNVGQFRPERALPDLLEASGTVRCLAFSPDGKALAVGLADGSVERLDQQEERKETRIFRSSNNSIEVLAFSPDGRSIAIGGTDRFVRVLDFDKETVRLTLPGPRRPITGLAFSPDGKLVASASDGEPELFVWDATSGEVASNPTLPPDASTGEGLACLAFSPDGRSLFAGGERGVTTFDMTEGRRPPPHVARGGSKAGKERATLRGHASPVRSLAFAEGGGKLVTRGLDGAVKVWDLVDGNRERHTFGGADFKVQSMALRPDGKTLAVGLQLPANRLKPGDLEAQVGDPPAPEKKPDAPPQRISDEVKFWDLDSGEGRGMINAKATNGGVDRVVAVAYTRDGRTLATTSQKGVIRTWDADTLEPRADLDARERAADLVQFSPDGKTLMGADASGLVTLWDFETGKIRASFTHDGGMNQVFFSPDGRFIATAGGRVAPTSQGGSPGAPPASEFGPGSGGDVRLWDPATGRRVAVLPMESGKVSRIAFSRDGKALAASTTGPVATIWDVDSARPVATLAWPSGEAKYLAFSPDGKALAIGGEDDILRVWDVPAGTLRADLIGHADAINWVAFSPDGKTIATAGRDALVKLWDAP